VSIVYAVHVGLSASAILDRLHGNVGWAAFYLLFVAAAAVHAPIGMRTILAEMTPWRGRTLDGAAVLFAVLLLVLGARAVLSLSGGF
jgi:fumarate reductase subunit C